jgi:hypothetical protein
MSDQTPDATQEAERQFRRGYRQGFHAAARAYAALVNANHVPFDRAQNFMENFAADGELYAWTQAQGQAGDAAEPPDAEKTFLSRLGRSKPYSAG